jgi:hypothetical protein
MLLLQRTPTVKTIGYRIGRRYAAFQIELCKSRIATTDLVALGFNSTYSSQNY